MDAIDQLLTPKAHTVAPAFAHTRGPKNARIVLVGEAWGESEQQTGLPFMGNAGQLLNNLLTESGIAPSTCFYTNVIAARPADNKIAAFCGKKSEVGKAYTRPPLGNGKYIRPEFLPELDRLKIEIETIKPTLIIALGATATWALLDMAKIGSIRGYVAESILTPGIKVLATFHPSYLFQVYSDRPVVLADLMKARRESQFPHIIRPQRFVLVNPTMSEIQQWYNKYKSARRLACDIETSSGAIKCIGFAPSRENALVIPFLDTSKPDCNYWSTTEEELEAWNWVEKILTLPAEKIFQNGLFDLSYIIQMSIRPNNCLQDTMLLHHAEYPEIRKGLGFLGSIYTNEPAWKLMRHNKEELKRDE